MLTKYERTTGRELANKATKGPWLLEAEEEIGFTSYQVVAAVAPRQCVYVKDAGGIAPEANRALIAHVREAYPAALDTIDALVEALRGLAYNPKTIIGTVGEAEDLLRKLGEIE